MTGGALRARGKQSLGALVNVTAYYVIGEFNRQQAAHLVNIVVYFQLHYRYSIGYLSRVLVEPAPLWAVDWARSCVVLFRFRFSVCGSPDGLGQGSTPCASQARRGW